MSNPGLRRVLAGFALAKAVYGAASGTRGEAPGSARPAADGGRDPSGRDAPDSAPRPAGELAPAARGTAPGAKQLRPIPTQRLFGISVAELSAAATVERIVAWAGEPPARTIITANLDHVMKLRHDAVFQQVYREADLVTADGLPFVVLSRREGTPLTGRVAGSDLVLPLARAAAAARRSVFLFGSTIERLDGAARKLKAENPTLELSGAYAPPFGFERDAELHQELVAMFRSARPDIILVALGAPKQEIWSNAMADAVPHGVFVNIGASLDFLSDEVRRAPRQVRDVGLEWAWRAASEPRRLGPRYLKIIAALPSLYRMHRRDRVRFEAEERRRAMASRSDARYRRDRETVRDAEAEAGAAASTLEPLQLGPADLRDFERS